MYPVSQDYLDAIDLPVQRYRITGTVGSVSFTESNIVKGKLKITNKISEGSEVKIGSVYVGELRATFTGLGITRGQWVGKVITLSEGLYLPSEAFEDVPLGVYTIAEAKHTLEGVEVVAYDAMSKMDKGFRIDQTNGEPFDLLSLACDKCGVTLAQTRGQIESFPNGGETFYLPSESDIETWRDFVSWIAQTLASVATINRDGELELRQYSTTSSATIDETQRFSGCSFSDFAVKYTGCSVVKVEESITHYVSVTPDDGLTYNLGQNPFLQADDDTMQQALINSFSAVQLVPFSAQMLGGAVYDLGDCLTFTGGVAAGAKVGVMGYSYSYNGGYKVEGYGSNPDLANARSKTDKDISGLIGQMDMDKPRIFAYTNSTAVTIADGDEETVCYLHVVAKKMTRFVLQLEVNHLAETTEIETASTYTNTDLNITGKIYINDVLQDFSPVEVEQDGTQGYFLTFTEQVPQQGMEVRVDLACSGGSISVSIGDVQAYLMGPGFDDFKIESITVTSLPNNLFPYGLVNYDGLVIDGVFNDGSQLDVTDDCAITPAEGTAISGDAEVVHMSANYNNGQFTEEFDAPVNPLYTFKRQLYGTVFTTQYANHKLKKVNSKILAVKKNTATSGSEEQFTLSYVQLAFNADHYPIYPAVSSYWRQTFARNTPIHYFTFDDVEYVIGGNAADVKFFDYDTYADGSISAVIHDDPNYSASRTVSSMVLPNTCREIILDGYVIYTVANLFASDRQSAHVGYAYSKIENGQINTYFRQVSSADFTDIVGNYQYKILNNGNVEVYEVHFNTADLYTRRFVTTLEIGLVNAGGAPIEVSNREEYVMILDANDNITHKVALINTDTMTFDVVDAPPLQWQSTDLEQISYIADKGIYVYFWKDSTLPYPGRTPVMYLSRDFKTWNRGGTDSGGVVTCGGSWGTNLVEDGEYIVGTCYNGSYDQIAFAAHIDAEV
jgi:hypothetical protein